MSASVYAPSSDAVQALIRFMSSSRLEHILTTAEVVHVMTAEIVHTTSDAHFAVLDK